MSFINPNIIDFTNKRYNICINDIKKMSKMIILTMVTEDDITGNYCDVVSKINVMIDLIDINPNIDNERKKR